LLPGDNFIEGGWSQDAYEELISVMLWALSEEANGALNLRVPEYTWYTRDVAGVHLMKYFEGVIDLETLVD